MGSPALSPVGGFWCGLDSHALEGAEGLAHGLDFALVGSLITDSLTEQGRDLGDASEGFAQVGFEAVEVVDGGFDGWLAGGGDRADVATASVDWNLSAPVDVRGCGPVGWCCCHGGFLFLGWGWFFCGWLVCRPDRHHDHLASLVPEMQSGGRVGETDRGEAVVEGFGEVVAVQADRDVWSCGRGSGKGSRGISCGIPQRHDSPLVNEEDAFVSVAAHWKPLQNLREGMILRKHEHG